MSVRITLADLDRALEAYRTALDSAGIDSGRLELHQGSPTYGRPFRLYRADDRGGLREPPVGSSYLGRTKLEAFQSLADRVAIMYDLTSAKEPQS